jgi:hypothetical protein
MSGHTAFRYCLDPTVEQRTVLARHAGAARFAYNQCLAMVKIALTQRRTDPEHRVPWTRFDLINAVGLPQRETPRPHDRVSPIQEENHQHRIVPSPQQTLQNRAIGDPHRQR